MSDDSDSFMQTFANNYGSISMVGNPNNMRQEEGVGQKNQAARSRKFSWWARHDETSWDGCL